MQVHEIETKTPERRELNLGGEGDLKWYRCLKGTEELPFEYCGYSLRKDDQISSSLPVCGKGIDLTKPHAIMDDKGKPVKNKQGKDVVHPPAFEEIIGMVPADAVPVVPDTDPRNKDQIAEDIFIAFEEKINPLRISRPDIILHEKKLIRERDMDAADLRDPAPKRDAKTAVIDEKVM